MKFNFFVAAGFVTAALLANAAATAGETCSISVSDCLRMLPASYHAQCRASKAACMKSCKGPGKTNGTFVGPYQGTPYPVARCI